MNVWSFDPGVHHVGWACFRDSKLIECGLVREGGIRPLADTLEMRFSIVLPEDEIVIEKPQVYKQARWKGDPNDLIDLALVAGAIGHICRRAKVSYVRPHDWKGNARKDAVEGWIRKRLGNDERLELRDAPASLQHNVIDAVGVGLWRLGRLR